MLHSKPGNTQIDEKFNSISTVIVTTITPGFHLTIFLELHKPISPVEQMFCRLDALHVTTTIPTKHWQKNIVITSQGNNYFI